MLPLFTVPMLEAIGGNPDPQLSLVWEGTWGIYETHEYHTKLIEAVLAPKTDGKDLEGATTRLAECAKERVEIIF